VIIYLLTSRRRDNINERINDLATLLPDIVSEMNAGHPKPNKGLILRRSVDYIKHVQGLLLRQNERIEELETVIRSLSCLLNVKEESLNLSCPLGTRIAKTDILIPPQSGQMSSMCATATVATPTPSQYSQSALTMEGLLPSIYIPSVLGSVRMDMD
jgi:hypothetical protein